MVSLDVLVILLMTPIRGAELWWEGPHGDVRADVAGFSRSLLASLV